MFIQIISIHLKHAHRKMNKKCLDKFLNNNSWNKKDLIMGGIIQWSFYYASNGLPKRWGRSISQPCTTLLRIHRFVLIFFLFCQHARGWCSQHHIQPSFFTMLQEETGTHFYAYSNLGHYLLPWKGKCTTSRKGEIM